MTAWLLLTLAMGASAYWAIWSRYPSKARWLAVSAFLVASPMAGLTLFQSLGWAVPVTRYLAAPEGEFNLLGVKLKPDVAIFVMLDVDGGPRLFSLPWNAEKASDLQRMMEQGEGDIKVRLQPKSGESLTGEFYLGNPDPVAEAKPPEQHFTF